MDDVYLRDEATLRSPAMKQALARRLVEDSMSRLGSFIFLEEAILNHADDGGKIVNEYGAAIFVHPDIVEEAYAYELSFSWTTDIKVYATRLPKRRSPNRHLLRLQLWDAAYKIVRRPILIG